MKIMIKLLILALIGVFVAPMVMKGPDGQPLISWKDFFSSPAPDDPSPSVSPNAPASPSGLTTVYKWKDKDGQWHFSDKPQDHVQNETLKYNPNANIIQSLAKKEEEPEVVVEPVKEPKTSTEPSLTTVPLTEVPELMDQAKQYQQMVDQRNEMLQQYNTTKK
ncbi:DUF4124 domain-containing protein [Litoribrevibacter euphylliae]|uniref:DUF4124 domain-containing protein n=1 Tax=Litoribrevibacter euphylliae TaxID=1834034 RepID=A0ABV7HF69_9GAMM